MPPTDPTNRSSGPREPRRQADAAGTHRNEGEPADGGKVDFGAFVSSRVRSSAEKFKGEPDRPTERPVPRRAPVPTRRDAGTPSEPTVTPATPRERPRRYWRDAAGETPEASTQRPADESTVPGDGGRGGGGNPVLAWYHENSEGRPWLLPALIAAAVVLLLLIVFLLTRFGGGGSEPTPVPTTHPVIESSTAPAAVGTPPPPTNTQPTPTETPRTGGDNQRGELSPEDSASVALLATPGVEGQVARSCPERCLVRVPNGAETSTLLSELGTRPSFAADSWQWLVATPHTISRIEQADPNVVLVDTNAETQKLYAVKSPSDVVSEDAVQVFGTIVDDVDSYRIVETESVPAEVGDLTNAGYVVSKLAPAPISSQPASASLPKLAGTDIGTLAPLVSADNITATIKDLQAMGSADGTGVGSRYYSLGGNQMAADYLFQKLESYGARVWYEDFVTPDGLLLVNVVGELPGEDTSKIYGVMAHLDTTATIPSISPGADDNATGVAASLEIARVLGGYQLKYPVRIVFTNAEDSGLLGSDAWAKRAVAEKTPIEGVFNIDSVGSARKGRVMVLNGDAKSAWMSDLMLRINDAYGFGEEISALQTDAIVADDNYVRAQGIESIMIARELFGESPYHHTANDLFENVSVPHVVASTQVVLLTMAALVQ